MQVRPLLTRLVLRSQLELQYARTPSYSKGKYSMRVTTLQQKQLMFIISTIWQKKGKKDQSLCSIKNKISFKRKVAYVGCYSKLDQQLDKNPHSSVTHQRKHRQVLYHVKPFQMTNLFFLFIFFIYFSRSLVNEFPRFIQQNRSALLREAHMIVTRVFLQVK